MGSFTRTTRTRFQATAATAGGRGAPEPAGLLVLSRYRLHRPLGTGGFATVWMAWDERLERDVAVKVLARERVVGGRFEREARAAARLSHPGIVTLYEAAVDDDGAYLVSELVRGATLSQLLEAGRLSDRDVVEVGISLTEALGHAHAQGVVHRDVKPSNVLIPENPAGAQVAKLTDFGVARLIGADTLTRTGDVVGTAAYMAPEQADGREAGTAADLYSLALVLYEALTGVNPIALGLPAQRARRLGAHLPPLRRHRRDLPGDLGHALDQALRPRAQERGSLAEFRSALLAVLDEVADQPGTVEPPWPRRARPREWPAQRDWEEGSRGDVLGAPMVSPAAGSPIPPPAAEPAPSLPVRWPERALAGAAAGAAAAWLTTLAGGSVGGAPAAVGLVAALLVAILPRLGWLTVVAGLAVLLAAHGRSGAAVIVASAGLVPVLVLVRHRTGWALAALAVGLGAVGLAGAWPAVAGRARTPWRRAGLGAVGWLWVLLAGLLAGHGLYTRLPGDLPDGWPASAAATISHVLSHILVPGLLVPALIWGLAALAVPWITRRPPGVRVVLASAWSAGLGSATVSTLRLCHAGVQAPSGTVVLGALAGWIALVAPAIVSWRFTGPQSTDSAAGLA